MDSVHGTKTVRLQRKKTGLDFSVKGGKEHGIPIVVSWIKPNGAAGERDKMKHHLTSYLPPSNSKAATTGRCDSGRERPLSAGS